MDFNKNNSTGRGFTPPPPPSGGYGSSGGSSGSSSHGVPPTPPSGGSGGYTPPSPPTGGYTPPSKPPHKQKKQRRRGSGDFLATLGDNLSWLVSSKGFLVGVIIVIAIVALYFAWPIIQAILSQIVTWASVLLIICFLFWLIFRRR